MDDLSLIPPEGTAKVGQKVYELVGQIIKDKIDKGLHAKWLEHYRLSKNRPWKSDANVPLTSANLLHTHRQRTVNTLTDNEPAFNVAQVGQVEDEDLQRLQWTAEHWWREQEQQDVFAASVSNGEMNGIAIEKVWFDPDLEIGIGEVRTEVIDPFHFGFWPLDLKRRIQDSEACFHFYPKSVRWVKRQWPDQAAKIRADKEVLNDLGSEREKMGGPASEGSSSAGAFWSKIHGVVSAAFGGLNGEQDGVDPQTLVIECWVRDGAMEDDGEMQRGKYPGGIRRITVCSGGQVVLEDKANPSTNPNLPLEQAMQTYLWDKFPFIVTPSIEDPCSLWGQSDWEQLSGLQKSFSKALSQIEYFKDKAVRSKVINPLDSGVHNSEFTNDVGIINPASSAQAQGIKYLEMNAAGLLRDIEGVLTLFKDLFFLVAGTFEMEQANAGRSDMAYKAIAALLEHASTMMRGKIRNYQRLIRERGRMYLSLAANYYTEERYISYDGPQGATETTVVTGEQLIQPAKLTVVSGSTLPRAEMARREEALLLFKSGAYDDVALLEELDVPGRGEILQRKRAGQAGMITERLQDLGADEEMLSLLTNIAQMDDKEFKRAAESGELPALSMPQQVEDTTQGAEADKASAEARKASAEADLAQEKVFTERANQKRILAGIKFDALNMASEVGDLQTSTLDDRPGYNEQGMQSNNLES